MKQYSLNLNPFIPACNKIFTFNPTDSNSQACFTFQMSDLMVSVVVMIVSVVPKNQNIRFISIEINMLPHRQANFDFYMTKGQIGQNGYFQALS